MGPWSVLRVSLIFYFCLMVAIWLALALLYQVLGWIGVIDSVTRFLSDVYEESFRFHAWWIFSRLFAAGLVMVVFGSVVNLFAAFLYNLISGFTGGIEMTLSERR